MSKIRVEHLFQAGGTPYSALIGEVVNAPHMPRIVMTWICQKRCGWEEDRKAGKTPVSCYRCGARVALSSREVTD